VCLFFTIIAHQTAEQLSSSYDSAMEAGLALISAFTSLQSEVALVELK